MKSSWTRVVSNYVIIYNFLYISRVGFITFTEIDIIKHVVITDIVTHTCKPQVQPYKRLCIMIIFQTRALPSQVYWNFDTPELQLKCLSCRAKRFAFHIYCLAILYQIDTHLSITMLRLPYSKICSSFYSSTIPALLVMATVASYLYMTTASCISISGIRPINDIKRAENLADGGLYEDDQKHDNKEPWGFRTTQIQTQIQSYTPLLNTHHRLVTSLNTITVICLMYLLKLILFLWRLPIKVCGSYPKTPQANTLLGEHVSRWGTKV